MLENTNFSRWARIVICASLCLLASGAAAVSLEELPTGHWYEVPNSNLDARFPNPAPPGWTGPRSVMDAWSGGAYDTLRDRLIIWGGGHMDYSGNEIYVFDLETLAWTRLTEPTPDKQVVTNSARYADGQPSSRHTYNYLQYSPELDALVSLGYSAAYGDPSADGNDVDAFHFDTMRWKVIATKPANGTMIGSISAHDSMTGRLWHHGSLGGGLAFYDPVENRWSPVVGEHFLEHDATAAIDPERQIMVATGGGKNNGVFVWDLERPGSPRVVDTSGPKTMEHARAPGFVYDPVREKFVGWRGGASVYTLNADTWSWEKIDPASGNMTVPTRPNTNGTYGRFRYVPSIDAFILVNHTHENVFVYKLTAAAGRQASVESKDDSLAATHRIDSQGENALRGGASRPSVSPPGFLLRSR